MIWALLAILGVPIWLIIGALTAAILSRRRFTAQPGVFRFKARQPNEDSWPRRLAYGRMVHDVFVVNSGLALVRTTVRGVRSIEMQSPPGPVAGFDEAVIYAMTFDDGSRRLVAVEPSAGSYLEALR